MDEKPTYRPGTQGGLCGCLVATILAVPASILFTLAITMGDCLPEHPCHENDGWLMAGGHAVIAALVALLAFSLRALINWWLLRRYDPAAAGRPPIWALLVAVPLLLLFARIAWEVVFPMGF
jgi:hypothetical protein